MRGVDATLEVLKRGGVDSIFGIPGGPLIPLFDALFDDPDLRLYLTRHEPPTWSPPSPTPTWTPCP